MSWRDQVSEDDNGEPDRSAKSPGAPIHRLLPALAAASPSALVVLYCVLFGAAATPNVGYALSAMGLWLYPIVGTAMAAWFGTTVLLYLAGRGAPIPAAATLFVASLPWLAGAAGTRSGVGVVAGAIREVDPAARVQLMAVGIREAIYARWFGATLACGLLAAVALGLGLGALAQRAPGRSFAGAALGVAGALPLLRLACYGALALGVDGVTMALAALGSVVAGGLAGAGAGADDRGRSGALAAASPLAAGLAVLAAVAAASSIGTVRALGTMASPGSVETGALWHESARGAAPLAVARSFGPVLAVLAAAPVAGWAALRRRPSPKRLVGGATVIVVVLLTLGIDAWVMREATRVAERFTARSWEGMTSFSAIRLPRAANPSEVGGLAIHEGLVRLDGAMVAPHLSDALDE